MEKYILKFYSNFSNPDVYKKYMKDYVRHIC